VKEIIKPKDKDSKTQDKNSTINVRTKAEDTTIKIRIQPSFRYSNNKE